MTTEADQTLSGDETAEWSALLQAIDSTAQSNLRLSTLFHPIEPLAMRRYQWVVMESALSHHNPLLLAAHPNSQLLQAVIQQVHTHYRTLEQLEQRLRNQHKPLQDRDARIELVKRLGLPPRLACALVDYPVEGFSIGADATQELSGIRALQRGVERYNATQLLPSKLLKTVQNVFPLEQINHWVHHNDSRPFSGPLGSEQTAQIWYQQSKALWAQQVNVDGEQSRLNLLELIADQPIKSILPEVALIDDSQHGRGLISESDEVVDFLKKSKEFKPAAFIYTLVKDFCRKTIDEFLCSDHVLTASHRCGKSYPRDETVREACR